MKLLEFSSMCGSLDLPKNRIVLTLCFTALIVGLAACSSSGIEQPTNQAPVGADEAPGTVSIDILESSNAEHYWQYELRPSTGLVRKVKDQNSDEAMPAIFSQPAGAIQSCSSGPQANSSDGKYLASCRAAESDEFFVLDKKTNATVIHWRPAAWRGIRGFAWSPNSRSVALLDISEHYGKNPIEILSALSGHPVPHDTVYLDVFDSQTGKLTEYVVRTNVVSAFTRILEWSE